MSKNQKTSSKASHEVGNLQRSSIHSTIWKIADELRGSVDGWDFKVYVLGTLLYRFLSENLTEAINKSNGADLLKKDHEDRFENLINHEFKPHDVKNIVETYGYFIHPKDLFANVLNATEKTEGAGLNTRLEKIFKSIEESASENPQSGKDFSGLFAEFKTDSDKLGSDAKERNARLLALLNGINTKELNSNLSNNKVDIFGDAYEYLMGMYASDAGKSGGEYFTPPSVSNLLTNIAIQELEASGKFSRDGKKGSKYINSVYDPTCGSGSLLLTFTKVLDSDQVDNFYGQEVNITTYNLCRMNMLLHGVPFTNFDIRHGDTLAKYQHGDIKVNGLPKKFDVVVSNPPYSIKWAGKDDKNVISDPRFNVAGAYAPKSKADFAFILHSLSVLADDGVAAIVTFPGIFNRSGAEMKIRKYLVEENYVDAIIKLPKKLFYGTTITTNVLVLKKNRTTTDILFVDASREFVKAPQGRNNVLTTAEDNPADNNVGHILELLRERKNVDHVSYVASKEEVVGNNYNLGIIKYITPLVEDWVTESLDELNIGLKDIKSSIETNEVGLEALSQQFTKFSEVLESLREKGDIPKVPMYEVTAWNQKDNIKLNKEGKTLKIPNFGTVAEMLSHQDVDGDVKILTTYKSDWWAKEETLPEKKQAFDGEIVYIPKMGKGRIDNVLYYKGKFITSGNCIGQTLDPKVLSTRYLFWFLKYNSSLIEEYYDGGASQSMDLSSVVQLAMPLPSIDIQDQVVEFLDNYEEVFASYLDNVNKAIELETKRHKKTLQEIFK